MKPSDSRKALRPSVLDRLLNDPGPQERRRSTTLRQVRSHVARDLEWLLNTRISPLPEWAAFREAYDSVLTYGIPDLSTISHSSSDDRQELAAQLQSTIQRFEPRLIPRSVHVEVSELPSVTEFRLRYRISATLLIEPIREPVLYDTDFDLESQSLSVREVG